MRPPDDTATKSGPRAGLLRLAGGTLILKVTGQALLFGVMVLLARLLGDRSYGQYVFALAWLRVWVLLVKVGYDSAMLRFLPAYAVEGRWDLARGLLRAAVTVTLTVWLVTGAGAAAVILGVRDRLEPGLAPTLLLTVGVVLVQALVEHGMAVLRAWNRPLRAVLPNFVVRPLAVGILVVVGLLAVDLPRTSGLAMGAMGLASALCLVLVVLWCRRSAPKELTAESARATALQWRSVAVTMLFISGVHVIMTQTDTIMVGALLDSARAGYYGTAVRLSGLVLFGLVAASNVVAPRISAAHAAGDRTGLQAMLDTSSRGVLAFTVPVALVFALAGKFVLGLWGESFTAAYGALVILAGAQALSAASGPNGLLLNMTGHERTAAAVMVVSALLNVALNALFIPRWGLMGAGLATGLTTVLWNITLVAFARRRLGVSPTVLWPVRSP
ncbi:MAG: flippase [bacterium]|nr:flippase [bacterium]